ncbi:hypothetical protein IE53DRAFT_363471 [Violaceomyces palustris]|uniref:Uncharacterized protein n=1 Tax=Violaceomyces palustris TaxID=1673888 RepID=A0ACD0NT72_9BASI|nr:hypothetical protein IE53DRAFT_363471 [Violaceomyces palustris]
MPPPPEGSKPLAITTIKGRLGCILRQLKVRRIAVRGDLWKDVMEVMRHLAHKLHYYPTATLKKMWISVDTVSTLIAAVWDVLAHTRHHEVRSVPTLLSLQTVLLLMDQCGARISSWLDRCSRWPEEVGRYLRWSMVMIRLCGNTESHGPSFIVNLSCNATKHAGRLGDALFHVNTFATNYNEPKSKGIVSSFVALEISQGVMSPDLAGSWKSFAKMP